MIFIKLIAQVYVNVFVDRNDVGMSECCLIGFSKRSRRCKRYYVHRELVLSARTNNINRRLSNFTAKRRLDF